MKVIFDKKKAVNWFKKRTLKHITLVKKYTDLLVSSNKYQFADMNLLGLGHDSTKYSPREYSAQVYLSYKYKLARDAGEPVELEVKGISQSAMGEKVDLATLHHIMANKHHPEYWAPKSSLSNFSRENPTANIDGTRMPNKYIMEMVCDWCAVSEELNTNPYEWADNHIGTRWLFTEKQQKLIYTVLDIIWK